MIVSAFLLGLLVAIALGTFRTVLIVVAILLIALFPVFLILIGVQSASFL